MPIPVVIPAKVPQLVCSIYLSYPNESRFWDANLGNRPSSKEKVFIVMHSFMAPNDSSNTTQTREAFARNLVLFAI